MEHRKFLWLWASVILISGHICAQEHTCSASDDESILHPGFEYSYRFQTNAFGEAVGSTNYGNRMNLMCDVLITHSHECFYSLILSSCAIEASGGTPDSEPEWIKKENLPEISRYPVAFSLINGTVGQLYSDTDDPVYYVNIKRAAISAFLVKLSSTSQKKNEKMVDIHGTCPMQSSPISGVPGGVKRTKDMMYCAYPSRPDWQFSPWSMFWNMSFIQYQINSTFECEYLIDLDQRNLDNMFCKERHAIGLESTHRTTTAVQTNIHYQMKFVKATKLENPARRELPQYQSSVVFQYNQTPDPDEKSQPENFLPQAQEMLSEMVEISQDEMRLFLIPKFNNFIALLRTSYSLLPLVKSVRSCDFLKHDIACNDKFKELGISYLSDALVQCNTVPCFEAVADLAIKSDLSASYLNFVLYSLSNMHFTKPQIIKTIKNICDHKDSRFCWLVLGTMIRNYHNLDISHFGQEIELKEVAAFFQENIAIACNVNNEIQDAEHFSELLIWFKAVGNAGNAFLKYIPNVANDVLGCIKKNNFPSHIRSSAIETLRKLDPCSTTDFCKTEFQTFLLMLSNPNVDNLLRISSYDHLMLTPEEQHLEVDLTRLLLEEKNSDLLTYISSDLQNRLENSEFRKEHSDFVSKLEKLLDNNDIFLEEIRSHPVSKKKSHVEGSGKFFKLSFLPEEMQGFGSKLDTSYVAPFFNSMPRSFSTNYTMQLFSKIINLFEAGSNFEGWQTIGLAVQKVISHMNTQQESAFSFEAFVEELRNAIVKPNPELFKDMHFDEKVLNNIRKVLSLYNTHKSTIQPFLNMYFGMFGNTLAQFTSDDFDLLRIMVEEVHHYFGVLRKGDVFHNTHVIRIIEAYHQVPTMLGLSLNWTTNATFAFSLRGSLKNIFNQGSRRGFDIHTSASFQPSMALTFLNRMVLDFPSVTQIGVQANSSGFTSTHWKASLDYSDSRNQRILKLDIPEKSQKVLELFRTNQMIKHDRYDNIADWDIERTSSVWCTEDSTSSIIGLKVCHERSYPKVTHRIKPWALMAGSCKWRLEAIPMDQSPKSYTFEIPNLVWQDKRKQLQMVLSPPGEQSVLVDFESNDVGELTTGIRIPSVPKFEFSASQNKIILKEMPIGYKNVILVKLPASKYELTYTSEDKQESRKEETSTYNKSPNSKRIITTITKKKFKFDSSFSIYEWTMEINRQGHSKSGSVKMAQVFSYLDHDPKYNWLSSILPPNFWQSPARAWVQLNSNYKFSTDINSTGEGMTDQQWSCHIDMPQESTGITFKSFQEKLQKMSRQQMFLNLTKHETSTSKMLSFANLTYASWSSIVESAYKTTNMFNFTIPLQSWSASLKTSVDNEGVFYDAHSTNTKMVPKYDEDSNYVGWWSDDVSDHFRLSVSERKLKFSVRGKYVNNSQLTLEFPNIKEEDIHDANNHGIFDANVIYKYPASSSQEFVEFNGKFIVSTSQLLYRFQKTFTLFSSYLNTQLDSDSVYRRNLNKPTTIDHGSFLTHKGTQTKAYYNMNYKQDENENGCVDHKFSHNISSHVLDFSSNVFYVCHTDNPKLHTLKLNLDSSSTYWNMLNARIRQLIEDESSEFSYESMNFTHPLMNINVNADWRGRLHTKIATFTKQPENINVATLRLKSQNLKNQIVLDLPIIATNAQVIYRRKITNDKRKLKLDLYFPNEEHKVFDLQGIISNPHARVWTVQVYPESLNFTVIMDKAFKNIVEASVAIANDPNHPLNKILAPALKMPLAEYISSLSKNMETNRALLYKSLLEVVTKLKPFSEPLISTLGKTLNTLAVKTIEIYSTLEQKSIAVWAINYFQLPQLLQKGIHHWEGGLYMLKNILEPPDELVKFTFADTTFLHWPSFTEVPRFLIHKFFQMGMRSIYIGEEDPIFKRHHNPPEENKVAMIFGPRHVYTFDGVLYEFPDYPSNDCTFLLAHDVIKNLFTAVTTSNDISLLFPEITIRINSKSEVFINQSQVASNLPIHSENRKVSVIRDGKIVKVWSPSLTVLCDGENEFCLLELSGWQSGSTIGLLGNADGEIHNEFSLTDGTIVSDVLEFAKHFEISGQGKCRNLKSIKKLEFNASYKERCLWPLKNACDSYEHRKLDFLESCMIDVSQGHSTCYSTMALAALCYYKRELMYFTCSVDQWQHQPLDLDIVLVVDEHAAGDHSATFRKGLELLLDAVHDKFQSERFSDIQFSLIGFNGEGSHFKPSIHTVGGKVRVPHKIAVNELLKTLEFKGQAEVDPIDAYEFALEALSDSYTYNKVYIVFTSNDKQNIAKIEEHQKKSEFYRDVIAFTVADYPSIEKGKKVYGVRSDGLIFPSPKDEESYMDYPKGTMAKITSASKGSVFLKKFVNANSPASYFTEFAEEIWSKVHSMSKFRSCIKIRSGWWYFHTKCAYIRAAI